MINNLQLILGYTKSLFKATIKEASIKKKKKSYSISKLRKKHIKSEKNYYIIYQELFILKALFSSCKKLLYFFKNPTILFTKKANFLIKLFPGLSSLTKSFIKILASNNDLFLIPDIFKQFHKMMYTSKNFIEISVILGNPIKIMNLKTLFKLAKNLKKSDEIFLKIFYDPRLFGGFILKYNNIILDLSLLNFLKNLILPN